MDKITILCLILVVFSLLGNIVIFLNIRNNHEDKTTDPHLMAQLILLDKKVNLIQNEIETLNYAVNNIEPVKVKEVDEMASYLNSGMSISDIAKKKNVSIREVELMLKMKGL